MGYTISCDLTLRERHPAHYWWPLIFFEVLRYHHFSFDNPSYRTHHQEGFQWFTQDFVVGQVGSEVDVSWHAPVRQLHAATPYQYATSLARTRASK